MTAAKQADSAASEQTRSRKKMYKNCDRCRQAKRACSAQYVSIAEALASKVACTNCKKKGQVCTFNSLINSFGGIPLGGLTGAAFAESLQEAAHAAVQPASSASDAQTTQDELMSHAELSTAAAKRPRDSLRDGGLADQPSKSRSSAISNVNAAFEVLNGDFADAHSRDDDDYSRERVAKRRKPSPTQHSDPTFQSGLEQPASSALVMSRAQSPFAFDDDDDLFAASTQSNASLFDILGFDIWGSAPSVRLAHNADRMHLNSDLLSVYEGAAESAFRVWVTDATTPYLLCADSMSSSSAAMALNKKVCLLDHASRRIFKTDNAARNVEKRVSDAYNAVLLAYAAQWPRHRSSHSSNAQSDWKPDEARIRLSLWKQARDKLMDAADAWSFRIVFALILFAWTEKPREMPDSEAWDKGEHEMPSQLHIPSLDENSALDSTSWQIPAEASTMMLATAMRKLKAFRLKIQQLRRKGVDLWSCDEPGLEPNQIAHRQAEATLLENTYHNLYWFGCMMDTELSVLRKYDAVIGDEDADLTDQLLSPHRANSLRHQTESMSISSGVTATKPLRKIWDEVIPANSQKNRNTFAKSWPCSEEDAKRTLAYATPIKVLLFRHVGRLQSSYWRQAPSELIERQISHVLSVVRHWYEVFAPFFASCIAHHADLPPSIQSWHVITATKWNLAAILLVELVQTMDRSTSDPFNSTDEIFAELRSKVCNQTAALIHAIQHSSLSAKTRTAQAEPSFDFIESTGSTILHSDPWPEISIHGFACVAKSEIKNFARLVEQGKWDEIRCAEHRIEKCIWALEQLSNRSSMAVDASVEVRKLLELHSPLRKQEQEQKQREEETQAGMAMMTDDVWQSCLKILNEGGASNDAPSASLDTPELVNGYDHADWSNLTLSSSTQPMLSHTDRMGDELFLDPLATATAETLTDGTSSRASSNHSLSPPLTSATMASLDYPSSLSISPGTSARSTTTSTLPQPQAPTGPFKQGHASDFDDLAFGSIGPGFAMGSGGVMDSTFDSYQLRV
ncbi:C6 transcription factor [Pseudozyma hubeiensis SY62]|uniref:C6 transcription factor n=1 Tax=Pseudozyma hubeiensis (strain SY62) TaxID=1305764 RepID=R9P6C4_PSEHS|nr:C6 transcription factor [Pseudozyma hubeiensis SY62]GAC93660.1 C6 transcription factor [Pseudozyma hubeiensis SY62]